MSKIYFAFIACIFLTQVSAANVQNLELRGGLLSTSSLTNTQLDTELTRLTNTAPNGCIVVRLTSELDARNREVLSAKGLTLLTCLGPKTWIARTGFELTKGFTSLYPYLTWVGEFKTEWKLDPWLAAGNIPMWTVERDQIEAAGLKVSGLSTDKRLVEVVEIPDHPWFIAGQFHPEFTSTPRDGHPLFTGFVAAAGKYQKENH